MSGEGGSEDGSEGEGEGEVEGGEVESATIPSR